MAKKTPRKSNTKKSPRQPEGAVILPMSGHKPDMNRLEDISDHVFNNMLSADERDVFEAMFRLASLGVTPDQYSEFYKLCEFANGMVEKMSLDADDNDNFTTDDMDDIDMYRRRPSDFKAYEPLPDAPERTLLIRIQMKDVTKPPMWREVLIPADYNFLQLHEVIQEVTGLEDCHLWQFNRHAYDGGLTIGVPGDENSWGIEDTTHEADETPLTMFLQKKGDKLEYVYDFGDDWIFTIEVKDVINKKCEHPECIKFKCPFNPIEDFGGVYSYLNARQDIEDWPKLTKREQTKRARDRGFDTSSEYIDFIIEHQFSLEDVNGTLILI